MKFSKKQRLEVYNKFGGRCAYCGHKIEYKDMQIDHIKPVLHNWSEEDKANLLPVGFVDADSFEECKASALKMAQWKDMQAIDEQGWRRDCPRADCVVLIKDEEQFYIKYWYMENLKAIQLKLMAHPNIKWRLIKNL